MSCGVGHRCGSHPMWLWLWHRPAATALTQPLAWESPYAVGGALKKKNEIHISNMGLRGGTECTAPV